MEGRVSAVCTKHESDSLVVGFRIEPTQAIIYPSVAMAFGAL